MDATPWRVVLITALPIVAQEYARVVRALGHEPVAVIVPRRRRRGDQPNPLAAEHLNDDPFELDLLFAAGRDSLPRLLRAYEPDLGLCAGFPWRITAEALEVPRLGIVNGHPSLLPRYRGPFPIAWAVRNGESEFGMTFHLMDSTFDTGNVLAQTRIPLGEDDDETTLFPRLGRASIELLPRVFERLAAGDRGEPQEGGDYQSVCRGSARR